MQPAHSCVVCRPLVTGGPLHVLEQVRLSAGQCPAHLFDVGDDNTIGANPLATEVSLSTLRDYSIC